MPKTFELAVKRKNREPIDTFDIPIRDENGDIVETNTFHLYAPSDSSRLVALQIMTRIKTTKNEQVLAEALIAAVNFMAACLEPDEYDKFAAIMMDPNSGMDAEPMTDMFTWIIEAVAARPTNRPSGSQPGPSTNGKPSTGNAPRKASTRSTSH